MMRLAKVAFCAAGFGVSALALAGTVAPVSNATSCLRDQIDHYLYNSYQRPLDVAKRYLELQRACSRREIRLCASSQVSDAIKKRVLHVASMLDDVEMRKVFLNTFPPHHNYDLERLDRYLEKQLTFCDPPIHQACESKIWEPVIEDYLARNGHPGARFLARWDQDKLKSRLNGLRDFLYEQKGLEEFPQDPKLYQTILETPGLAADSISIVSEQSNKKHVNDGVDKTVADALLDFWLRSFRWHLTPNLAAEGLTVPRAIRVDFKTNRMIELLQAIQEDHPAKLERAVNVAAAEANKEMKDAIQRRFPELMYILDLKDPEAMFHTATFHMPGYTPRENEALASFKARRMREGLQLKNEDARDEYIQLAKTVIEHIDDIRTSDASSGKKLLLKKVIEKNGALTVEAAKVIRKLKPGKSIADAIEEAFGVRPTTSQERLINELWQTQDLLSLPLTALDKMPELPDNVHMLGGDGKAGGAIDAYYKVRALLSHRKEIMRPGHPDYQIKKVFNALVEGDSNAGLIIRSAPDIEEVALVKTVGQTQVFKSADDAKAPLTHLAELNSQQRDLFYRQLTWNISDTTLPVKITDGEKVSHENVGPELLRAFIGHNKASTGAAEQFLKPIEDKLASADFLGPHWTNKYRHVALLSVFENDGTERLIVAGKDIDEKFKKTFMQALEAALRHREHPNVQFVSTQPHP